MPRELIAIAPRTPALREYVDPPLGAHQIRVRTEFASPKHGTELVGYRDESAAHRPYDRAWGAVLPRPSDTGTFPRPLGNMAVGAVEAIGSDVTRFQPGDRVFGHFPIRETQTVDETNADPMPAGLSAESAVCLDPAVMAFAMRDGNIKLGDRVAVFGMGAIGLFAVQLARKAGADCVIAVDPIETRRELARSLGADVVLDPRDGDGDIGFAIRRQTAPAGWNAATFEPENGERLVGGYRERATQVSNLGVDVAVEASGSIQALHHAIRATRYGGTVCVLSFYGGDSAGLRLGEEFHINRLQLISARAESLPMRDAQGWTLGRLARTTLNWLADGRLSAQGIVTPIVPFAESVDAYRAIDEHPEQSIKLGIRFS
ncbi:MAG: zinc-binding alcohol dehydrogenase [Xanthobacteraceae bacterium]